MGLPPLRHEPPPDGLGPSRNDGATRPGRREPLGKEIARDVDRDRHRRRHELGCQLAPRTFLPRTGCAARSGSALTGERLLRAHHAELVSLRVGQDGPGLSAGLPDVNPAGPECKKAVNLLVTILSA